ncbi:AbrB/MazE/SpoVT family DNA-binding domain-containing protein [Treponema sp. OMZ 788]|uniref:AbrB/MazE/SpoVT family DNA-binding domain-containing protein n=1 Tax=Treponema sp. OMZ 788 TaxID=2563664 RepID=UPI0020A53C61|nr:AbrB/MazE/SpoVT family DNA-binding domain-containing protein [Treponema sp. OMZ 788]UTC64456.1 AbrB/MazE/SpoVT family DNA-binding domain-containing protein [Treponema sp. OMZ 788]
MVISVIPIGNSRGIRFPKVILDKFSVKDKINMKITDNEIILTPVKDNPRTGWKEAFDEMHKNKDDILEYIPDSGEFEWEW